MQQHPDEEIAKFNKGKGAARNPYNKDNCRNQHVITRLESDWTYTHCKKCSHTFRIDDTVFITPDGNVNHDHILLNCSENQSGADIIITEEVVSYYKGITEAYFADKSIKFQLVSPENDETAYLIKPPFNGFKRNKCGICSHTIREHDIVVICPCSPDAPRCKIAVHLDPFRGLNCWGAWNSNIIERYCPAFSQKL
jgi:hypothetical protein